MRISGIFCVNPLKAWVCGASGTIRMTVDGGQNWSPLYSGTTNDFADVDVACAERTMAVGAAGLVAMTSNSGGVWNVLNPITSQDLKGVYFASELYAWVVGTSGTIFHTSDFGTT